MDDVEAKGVASPSVEVPMIEPDSVRRLRQLAAQGMGAKSIARELGLARNTVRRYLRGGAAAEQQRRPAARRLDERGEKLALELFEQDAEQNAVVVAELLREHGYDASVRTIQKLTSKRRLAARAATVATVRYETAPGAQMQIDFGQKLVWIGDQLVRVFLLVAVLSYSRRLFVKAFLAERQDDWREGIAAAFRRFGGVTEEILGDNARSLVLQHNRAAQAVTFHPGYLAFCKDWDVVPRACAPYRARTKGKTESGVKYAKRNGLAGRRFDSFATLELHLERWMDVADQRVHATTFERPIDRFNRDEAKALRPLPARQLATRQRRLVRRVSNDSFVDIDTVRYSVPHRLVRDRVTVQVLESQVSIYSGLELVASHQRRFEPHAVVRDPAHFAGLWRAVEPEPQQQKNLAVYERSLDEYAAALQAGAA